MAKKARSIGDNEIALIRAMIGRGLAKTKIQAYFTHPDRPMNFGRITNIGDGRYGRDVAPATNAEVDRFIDQWSTQRITTADIVESAFDYTALPPTNERRLRSMFSKIASGSWQLKSGETDCVECKQSFSLGPRVLRAVAALANNRGGFIFFGITDNDCCVSGLNNDRFQTTDPARISLTIRSAMEPMPRLETAEINFDGKTVGVIYVHAETDGPVISTKTEQEFREGTVYFRYPGESRPIGAAEFRKLLADRDRRLRESSRAEIGKLLELGDRGAVVDLTSNSETAARIVREGIDEADVLRNFVRQEHVQFPLAYLLRSCTTAKSWLPIFYYVQQSRLPLQEAIKIIEAKETSYVARKRDLLARLRGDKNALAKPWGRIVAVRDELISGKAKPPKTAKQAGDLATAMTTLPDTKVDLTTLLSLLRSGAEIIREDKTAKVDLWSSIYKASARVDELYFRPISAS